MQEKKIAIIADDDKETITSLVEALEEKGFFIKIADDTQHALQLIKNVKPCLVISEIGKMKYDGVLLFEAYKKEPVFSNHFKMVILTNNNDEKYEVMSFESGIDDYLLKPLRTKAFQKRIHRFFNKENARLSIPEKQFQIRGLFFNLTNKTIQQIHDKKLIKIQSKTFDLLFFLAVNNNQIFSRESLLQSIWTEDKQITSRSVDVHILKIRQVLGKGFIKTVKGVGYLFINDVE